MFLSLRNYLRALKAVRTRGRAPVKRRRSTCLSVEEFEKRCVPAVYTVTKVADDGTANTLRWARVWSLWHRESCGQTGGCCTG